jgi:hypothetical protein
VKRQEKELGLQMDEVELMVGEVWMTQSRMNYFSPSMVG